MSKKTPCISKNAQDITPFMVMEVLERAKTLEMEGRDIVHLEIGEPDFPTPACVLDAAKQAIAKGETHYTHSLGILPLREAIAEHYHQEYGVYVDPGHVLVTSGTSPALFMIFGCLLDPLDEVIIPEPYYPCYPNFIRFVGGVPILAPCREEDGFQLDPDTVKSLITPRTKAIVINSPSNPTGTILSRDKIKAVAELGITIVSDEIYHGLTYGEKAASILEYTDNAFVLNGFSKRYAMTGWRLGYVVAPKGFIRPLQKLQQNFLISAHSISQWAAISALKDARQDVENMRGIYNQRRIFMLEGLKNLGFKVMFEPKGAFYIFANIENLHQDCMDFCKALLEEAGVALTPGIEFGGRFKTFVRFSYANSLEKIKLGLERIKVYIKTRSLSPLD